MDGTPFDLLALPCVALQTIFSVMPPSQLLAISRTSERCSDFIKGMKFDVVLDAFQNGINVYYSDHQRETFRIGQEEVEMGEQEWRDSVMEITKLYRRSLSDISMATSDFDETWEWIKKEQSKVKKLDLTIPNNEDPQKVIEMILDNSELEQLKDLNFDLETSETFQYTDPFIFGRTPKYLRISDSSWFTVQNLMDCQVERCHLVYSKLTDKDLNLILKNWKNQVNTMRNWRFFSLTRVANTRTNINVVLDGLQRENEFHSDRSDFQLTYNDEFYLWVAVYRDFFGIEKFPRTLPFRQ